MLIERFVLSTPVAIDRNALDLITVACDKLKDGASTVNDLWLGEPHDLSTLLSDKVVFEKAQKEFWALKAASHAIQKLQSSLNAKMHFLQRSVSPAVLHHGFSNIPDEVLDRIVYEALYRMRPPSNNFNYGGVHERWLKNHQKTVINLSLVHRRFRSAVLRMPKVVADSEKKASDWNAIQLQNSPIHIYECAGKTFDSRVKCIAENLVVLSFRRFDPWTPEGKKFDVQLLPRLEELVMENGCIEDFLGAYQVPSLRRVSSRLRLEGPKLMEIMPQLTYLSSKRQFNSAEDIASYARTLAAGKKLRHLRLYFDARLDDLRNLLHTEKSYCLPALEDLQVEIKIIVPDPNVAEVEGGRLVAFLQSLDLPSLNTFEFTLVHNQRPFAKFVGNAMSCMKNKNRLRHLSFGSQGGYCTLTLSALANWAKSMPLLQSLRLENVEMRTARCCCDDIARIRDIRMAECRSNFKIEDFLLWVLREQYVGLKSLKLHYMSTDFVSLMLSQRFNMASPVEGEDFYVELASGDGVYNELQKRRPYPHCDPDDRCYSSEDSE